MVSWWSDMPSWTWTNGWASWLAWNAGAAAVVFLFNSFFEWIIHRFIMHSRVPFLPFPYDLHHIGHHGTFGAGETYHALNDDMRNHVTFVPRDYILILAGTTPIWAGVELLVGRPILLGCFLATFAGLSLFDLLHWHYHVPKDTRFQKTRFFRFLKEHHRRHHADTSKNYNVFFLPIADWCLGTLKKP